MWVDRGHGGPAVIGFVLFVLAGALAMSVDVPRTTYGIKSDEATYVAATLSAAFDGDLTFEKHDLERFAGLYHSGPEGIFLKRGKRLSVRIHAPFPFVHLTKRFDPDPRRLYFGKALAYPVVAAPFVRFLGLNGLLVFHVLLLAVCATAAYAFLAAQSSPAAAATFTTAFLGASVLPVYGVFLMPEIFNFTLVFVAYFLWLYKEVVSGTSRLTGRWTDLVAAALLGVGTYSKPVPITVLVAPLVVLSWMRRRWTWGGLTGAVAVAVAAMLFGLNAVNSGEFNYQAGDRKTFYSAFPFDAPDATWDRRGGGVIDDPAAAAQDVLVNRELPVRFARNVWYFLVGRHFGFVPYFFPGVVAILVWLASRARRDNWRVLTFAAFVASVVLLLLLLPFTWSGGGGPPGNRYLFNAYPTLLFLLPPLMTTWHGVVAWLGGALFTAKMLVDPFTAAKFTWLMTEKGPARRLPVELTMANDLPVMLAQPLRGRVQYRYDPGLLLYFLDQNAWPPEPQGMWTSGSGRADIIVRSAEPIDHLAVEAESPVQTILTVRLGARPVSVTLAPGRIAAFDVPAAGVRGRSGFAYLLSTRSTEGFVPHLRDPASGDYRNLGAQLRFRPVSTSAERP